MHVLRSLLGLHSYNEPCPCVQQPLGLCDLQDMIMIVMSLFLQECV